MSSSNSNAMSSSNKSLYNGNCPTKPEHRFSNTQGSGSLSDQRIRSYCIEPLSAGNRSVFLSQGTTASSSEKMMKAHLDSLMSQINRR